LQAAGNEDLLALADLSVCGGNGQEGQNDNGRYNAKLQHDISILEYFYAPQNQACRTAAEAWKFNQQIRRLNRSKQRKRRSSRSRKPRKTLNT
jgi:hypothetical protein